MKVLWIWVQYLQVLFKMEYIQLTWSNWNKICDFTKKWFITGVYLDKNKQPLFGPYDSPDYRTATETVGLYLKLNGKICLVKQNDYILKENEQLKIMNETQFIRKQKLDKINIEKNKHI